MRLSYKLTSCSVEKAPNKVSSLLKTKLMKLRASWSEVNELVLNESKGSLLRNKLTILMTESKNYR